MFYHLGSEKLWIENVGVEFLAINFMSMCEYVLNHFSCVCLIVTPWTVAHQGPLSMGFSRQEYWSGLLHPPPGDLPDAGIKPTSPALQADYLPLSYWEGPVSLLFNLSVVWPEIMLLYFRRCSTIFV